MEEFTGKWEWLAIALVFLIDHLIASSKLKSNSAIELVTNVIKFIFGLDKK